MTEQAETRVYGAPFNFGIVWQNMLIERMTGHDVTRSDSSKNTTYFAILQMMESE